MLDDGFHDDVQVEVGKAPYEIHARLFVVGHDSNLRSRLLVFAAAAPPYRLIDIILGGCAMPPSTSLTGADAMFRSDGLRF